MVVLVNGDNIVFRDLITCFGCDYGRCYPDCDPDEKYIYDDENPEPQHGPRHFNAKRWYDSELGMCKEDRRCHKTPIVICKNI
jgi:hypothetical protein